MVKLEIITNFTLELGTLEKTDILVVGGCKIKPIFCNALLNTVMDPTEKPEQSSLCARNFRVNGRPGVIFGMIEFQSVIKFGGHLAFQSLAVSRTCSLK